MKKFIFLALVSVLFGTTSCAKKKPKVDELSPLQMQVIEDLWKSRSVNYSDEEKIKRIIAYFKKKTSSIPNLKITFLKKIPTSKNLDFDAYIFLFENNGKSSQQVFFVNNSYLFSDFVNLDNMTSSLDTVQKILNQEANGKILDELSKDKTYIITLGRGDKHVFVFSDPLCPFCKQHINSIDENYLKHHTLHLILISVHGDEGFKKANLIYQNLLNVKGDRDKLRTIQYYYNNEINQEPILYQRTLALKALFDKYQKLGVTYTPYIIEVNAKR